MLSIKTVSENASAERLADQVQKETAAFFEQQKDKALKRLRERGLYFFPGDARSDANYIYIELQDEEGAKFLSPMKNGDELRDSVGRCISCGSTIGSKQRISCYMGCRNTENRLYPLDGQPVRMAVNSDNKWILKKEPTRFILYQESLVSLKN